MKYPDAESRAAALDGHRDDVRRAEHAVAKAAVEYVNHFFPATENGESVEGKSGALLRAVRALQRIEKRAV